MNPNIHDVAKQAGVSISMVSRVITGRGYVRKEKREQVQKIIKAMGYHPSALARGLRDKRTRTLGMLFSWLNKPDAADHFYGEILAAVLETCAAKNYQLLISNFMGRIDDEDGYYVKQILNDSRVEGVLLLAPRAKFSNLVKLTRSTAARVMLVGHTEQSLSYVDGDQQGAIEEALDFLMEKGHKKIAFLAGEILLNSNAATRYRAFVAGIKRRGLETPPAWMFKGRFDSGSGDSAAQSFLNMKKQERPTAMITSSNHQAVGFMKLYREEPRQDWIELVTFDNRENPNDRGYPISSLKQPFNSLGKIATEELIRELEENVKTKAQITVPLSLVKCR